MNTVTAPGPIIHNTSDIVSITCGALGWMFWGLIVFAVIMILLGGYSYATAGGDPEKVRKANRTLLYAAIAIVVALIARGVPTLIGTFFGQSIPNVC